MHGGAVSSSKVGVGRSVGVQVDGVEAKEISGFVDSCIINVGNVNNASLFSM